jgi:hypothetical protein
MHRDIERGQVRAQMLLGQYRSALQEVCGRGKPGVCGQAKAGVDDKKGMSKKERKKLKKKTKKIEKSQKKKEDNRVIVNLVNFDPAKVRIKNLPLRTVRKSKWASLLIDFSRSRSLQPKVDHDSACERQSKSVSCRFRLTKQFQRLSKTEKPECITEIISKR